MNASNGTDHDPTLARWLTQDMRALATLVETADVATFTQDQVYATAERLLESLESSFYAAQQQRQLDDDNIT
jgi:hypothetical protein